MAFTNSVRWFGNWMTGAPTISGSAAGGIVAALDACLIDGFGNKTINSLVVADEIATANISAGHDYEKYAIIKISGCTGDSAVLNENWQVASVPNSTSLTFACPGVDDMTATGTIAAIRSPVGFWEKTYSESNKGAYRSTHEDSTGLFLRVDDTPTGTSASPVRGYETMTNIDTGTRPFPTTTQAVNYTWRRASSSGAKNWTLVADERFLYLLICFNTSYEYSYTLYQFGDAARTPSGDLYHALISAHTSATPTYTNSGSDDTYFDNLNADGLYWARPIEGTETDPPSVPRCGSRVTSEPGDGETYPAINGNGYLFYYPILAMENGRIRGILPGLHQGLTDSITTLGTTRYKVLDPTDDRSFPLLIHAVGSIGGQQSYIGFNIQGPLR